LPHSQEKEGGIERENEMLLNKLINDDEVEKITIIFPGWL
jgi:hypothetical protein